jgi:hypothetical protein
MLLQNNGKLLPDNMPHPKKDGLVRNAVRDSNLKYSPELKKKRKLGPEANA